MGRGDDSKGSDLRRRAESMLGKLTDVLEEADLPPEKMRLLVHELRVHQIELEMQNDELRLAQLALEQARDRCLDLYDYAPVAYFTLDENGLVTEANLTAAHLLGIELKSLIKKPFSRLICKGDQDIYYFHYQQVLETRRRQTCEIKLLKKSGEQFHARLDSVAASDDNGDLSQLRIVVTDVTERKRLEEDLKKSHDELERRIEERTADLSEANEQLAREVIQRRQAEQALRKTQERLELALTGGHLGYWDWDVPNDYLIISSYWSDVLGYSLEETKPEIDSWKNLVHPEDMPQVMEVFNANLEDRIPAYVAEYRLLAKSGEWKWIMARGKVVERDTHGRPLRMAGIFVDTTSRKRAEQALRESEQRFRAIFEGAEDYIFLKDRSLRYTDVNPAVEKLFGVPKSEIIGRRHEDLYSKEGSKHAREADSRVLEGATIEGEQTRPIHGIPRTFLYTKTPWRDDSGEVIGILSISRDVTERKKAEVSPVMTHEYPSKAMQTAVRSAISAGKGATTVLLTGESGSGKDYLARYIHDQSDRATGPYFSVNCAAIYEGLAESELFGHERGSFTGAVGRKRGLLELAEGGTLLLNEIGELPLPLQAKLLTFLDTRKFTRVGGEKEISVNARLIAATNRDLGKEVENGGFRRDLFYRINVMSIRVPPLRERREDIPILIQEILSQLSQEMQITSLPSIDSAIMERLGKYDWPGNVRELRNVLERSLILSEGKAVTLNNLELRRDAEACKQVDGDWSFATSFPNGESLNEILQNVKRSLVDEALKRSKGSRQGAARLLGISRYSLKHYMKSLGMMESFPEPE
jgi:two-component system, NtrC family, response regulator AtoC